jgi:hypothetical protein
MILKNEDANSLVVEIKGTKITLRIPLKAVIPALRSVTNVPKFNIAGINDYIVNSEFDNWESILPLTKWQGPFDWSIVKAKLRDRVGLLFIATRFRPISPNTHLIAFTSDVPFATTNKFTLLKTQSIEEAHIQCLFLNSIVTIANMLKYMSSVTGAFIELKHYDLTLFSKINFESLDKEKKERLLLAYEKLSAVEFPSLLEQLRTSFWGRLELDKQVLNTLGLSDYEIEKYLQKLYEGIAKELEKLKETPTEDDS